MDNERDIALVQAGIDAAIEAADILGDPKRAASFNLADIAATVPEQAAQSAPAGSGEAVATPATADMVCAVWDVFSGKDWFMTVTSPLGWDAKAVSDSLTAQRYSPDLNVMARHCVTEVNPIVGLLQEVERLRMVKFEQPVAWKWLNGVISGLSIHQHRIAGTGQTHSFLVRDDVIGWIEEGERRAALSAQQPASPPDGEAVAEVDQRGHLKILNHNAIDYGTKFYTRPASPPVNQLVEALRKLVADIQGLMAESGGVIGMHLNGDIAPWSELEAGGRFERLGSLPDAIAALAAAGKE